MKKKILIAIFSLMILSVGICNNVSADIGAPILGSVEVRVTNPEGAEVFMNNESLGRIAYDSVVYGRFDNDKFYLDDCTKFGQDVHVSHCSVSLADIAKTGVIDWDSYAEEEVKYLYVFKDAVLYDFPSLTTSNVISGVTIPTGTKLSSEYYDSLFSFVKYGGVEGWVFNGYFGYYDADKVSVAPASTTISSLYTITDTNLYAAPNDTNTVLAVIPAGNEIITSYKYDASPKIGMYFTEYNGISGWVKRDFGSSDTTEKTAIVYGASHQAIVDGEVIIYSDINKSAEVARIPAYSIVYEKYAWISYNKAYFHLTYNGQSGWYLDGKAGVYGLESSYPSRSYQAEVELQMYDGVNGEPIGVTVPASSIFHYSYSTTIDGVQWMYGVYGGDYGWVMLNGDVSGVEDTDSDDYTKDDTSYWEWLESMENNYGRSVKIDERNNYNSDIIAICCVVAALVAAGGAYLVVRLRKKKAGKGGANEPGKADESKKPVVPENEKQPEKVEELKTETTETSTDVEELTTEVAETPANGEEPKTEA